MHEDSYIGQEPSLQHFIPEQEISAHNTAESDRTIEKLA